MTYSNNRPRAKAQSTRKTKELNDMSYKIVGAAIEVHKIWGPGLLESIYQKALVLELQNTNNLKVKTEHPVEVVYKGQNLDQGFRLDILVEDKIIIELKSIEALRPVHKKQLLSYLRITNKKLGLLINFNEEVLKDGITRLVNNF